MGLCRQIWSRPHGSAHLGSWAEGTRERRISDLIAASLILTQTFREAFDKYVDTFLDRRRELHEDVSDERLGELRDEYRALQRQVASTYRRVREHYRRFIEAEPDYDRRVEMFDPPLPGLPLDYPLTSWWKPITFDEAVANWANADDEYIRRNLDREHAVLDAFEDWLREADNHPLADDAEGTNRENNEILILRQRQ